MKIKYTVFNTIEKYELGFCDQLETKDIKLLRDIYVSREQLKEIAQCIKLIYRFEETNRLKSKYPLTTSLFLVWSAVYNYKDGDFWSVIFDNLKIRNKSKYQQKLGDIFLHTISKYELLSIKSDGSKKYLSPILMHGYISDNYAFPFFDYLNKVYSVLLNFDTNESNIDRIWDDVFEKEIDDNLIENEINNIINKINQIKNKKLYFDIPEELLYLNKPDVEKQESNIQELKKIISNEKSKIERHRLKIDDINAVFDYISEIEKRLLIVENIKSKNINYNNIEYAINLTSDIKYELCEVYNNKKNEIKAIKKTIKKTNNQLTIEEDKVKAIKMEIATIGKGRLEYGWSDIQEYKEIDHKLDLLHNELEEKQKLKELSQGVKNTSLRQVLTSSLNHLYKEAPNLFKEFIVDTFQAIDAVSKNEEVDSDYPLYDILIDWSKTYKIKDVKTSYTRINNKYSNNKNDKDTNTEENTQMLQLQNLNQPYIKYNVNNSNITLNIPEQSFYYNYSINSKPNYHLDYGQKNEEEINIQTYIDRNTIYIKETSIPIKEYSKITFKFEYFNLREEYVIDLSTIMIFSDKGTLLTSDKVSNGFYYVVCSNEWSSEYEGIICKYQSSLKGFKVYELLLNEDKAVFVSSNNSIVEYVGSDISSVSLLDFNEIEGITIDNIKVSTGVLPQLLIGLSDIDTTNNFILIHLDEKLILEKRLDELLNADFVNIEELSININLKSLIGKKKKPHISKIEMLILNKNKNEVFKESFWHLYTTRFLYKKQKLEIKTSYSVRIKYKEKASNTKKATIPLINEKGEKFRIYYNKVGWKNFNVKVPKIKYEFRDKNDGIVEVPKALLVSQLDMLKDLYVVWKANSNIPKTICLYDDDKIFESRLHIKDKQASANLYTYFDILNSTEADNSLSFKWVGGNRSSESLNIINVYKKWEVDNINSYATEDEDEYIIQLTYNYNFTLTTKKLLRVYNDNKMIFEKNLEDDQMIIYIKKSELKSLNIKIELVYFEKINSIFGKNIKEVVSAEHSFKLPSRIHNLNIIRKRGITATGFQYKGKKYQFKRPFIIKNIEKTTPINFFNEEIYSGQAVIEDKVVTVMFYINQDKKNLPFLLDIDQDGAQYQPKTGDVFWEYRKEKDIMGPIDDISYIVREE